MDCVRCQKTVKDGINGEAYDVYNGAWYHWECYRRVYHPRTFWSVMKGDPVPWHWWPILIILAPLLITLGLIGCLTTAFEHSRVNRSTKRNDDC